ncbi:Asp23/Gls24 family envelope stress response protein [Streptomyces sp. NPDC047990]|uniref:Asp23/Gls24 family envelope stress response protein n=1 Tax=Streptomyces sp. NPDC047990 TaxID=3365496 RepID=UPI00371B028F
MTTHTDPPGLPRPQDPDDELLTCGRFLSQVWEAWENAGADDPHLRECPYCRPAVRELEDLESAVRRLRDESPVAEPYDAGPLARRVMDVVRLELRPGRPLPLGGPAEDLWIMEAVAARTLRAAAETVAGVRAGSCRITPVPPGSPIAPGGRGTDPAGRPPDTGRPLGGDQPADAGRPDDTGRADVPRGYGDTGETGGTDGTDDTEDARGTGGTERPDRPRQAPDGERPGPPGRVDVRLDIHAPAGAGLPDVAEEVRRRVREAAYGRLGLDTGRIDIRVTDLTDVPADTEEGPAR